MSRMNSFDIGVIQGASLVGFQVVVVVFLFVCLTVEIFTSLF